MSQGNRLRDRAAFALLLSLPIFLLLIAFYSVWLWNNDTLHNPLNPHYIQPHIRTARSLSSCLATPTSLPPLTTTRLYMPLFAQDDVGYLTPLPITDGDNRPTWGVVLTSECHANAETLPTPSLTITHGGAKMTYSSTTGSATFEAQCTMTSLEGEPCKYHWYMKKCAPTMLAHCDATTIWPAWWDGGRLKTQTRGHEFTGTQGFGDFVIMQTPMPTPVGVEIFVETGEEEWNGEGRGKSNQERPPSPWDGIDAGMPAAILPPHN